MKKGISWILCKECFSLPSERIKRKHQFSVRLSDEEMKMLKEIGDHFSVDVGSVLFRMILRQYHEGRNEYR